MRPAGLGGVGEALHEVAGYPQQIPFGPGEVGEGAFTVAEVCFAVAGTYLAA
ncbi:MAG TPA: hypothetical protein VMI33_01795 [Streptosporangiaceae bacterium]|nr:hypothetical protein [Streptosporangiaceae bacterium]